MKGKNPEVDGYFENAKKWQKELKKLRTIALGGKLTEELKWRQPCYTFQENNIVIIQAFKEHCALMFFKGALLNDPSGLLKKPGDNSQSARRLEFTSMKEITAIESAIKAYIQAAIEVEEAGLKVDKKESAELQLPEELQVKLKAMPALKKAFDALTPGRQRAYVLYFSQAKQSKTRVSRIERYQQHILDGKGLND